jgi:hypothetical protein
MMIRWTALISVIAWVLGGCAVTSAGAQTYLQGYQGPYRGRVVDAETKEPIAGAVVVAIWSRERVEPLITRIVFHAAREVLTGPDGSFVLEAKDIEESAPRRTLPPYFEVFFPGYASLRSLIFGRRGFLQGRFETGITVGLPRPTNRKERLDNLVRPFSFSETPFKDVPHLMRLANQERRSLGLEPYPETGQ